MLSAQFVEIAFGVLVIAYLNKIQQQPGAAM
jgi:hypothetical protein